MILYRIDQPEVYPYVNGIIVFSPEDGIFIHPLTWRRCVITWNAANFTWEAAY
jgi:hypothetical protein